MSDTLISESDPAITARLTQGWEFLSGERKAFELAHNQAAMPPFAEFCFLIPLTFFSSEMLCGIVVLIDRNEALNVAAHMFDVARDRISEEELKDSSAEVCNVLADGMAQHFSGTKKVGVGVPIRVTSPRYDAICRESTVLQIYQSSQHSDALKVIIFNPLLLPA
jgi:hypothetical protein